MMDTQQLILEELREFRAAVTDWQQGTGERVSSLETQMYGLMGNGQPGRMSKVEEAIHELNKWRWRIVGIAAGVSGVFSLVGWIVVTMKK